MRRFFFLPRRLLTSTSDSQLEHSKERDHKFEIRGGVAVIIGTVAVFVLAFIFREHKTFLESWGPVAANGLIAIGITAQVHFSRQAAEKSEELRRRAIERLAKSEGSLKTVNVKLIFAESKLEPRRLTDSQITMVRNGVDGKIKSKINFVIEQNEKARYFASSIIQAVISGGAPVSAIPYKMPAGEKLICAIMLHCPGGDVANHDPLYEALVSTGIQVGRTSLTTLSLEMMTPTPLDVGTFFSPVPIGSRLPNDEYIVWVGEQSAFDDQSEVIRKIEEVLGPIHRGDSSSQSKTT